MLIEKWVSNPAANSFDYEVVTLSKPLRVTYFNVHSQTNTWQGWVYIYRGNVNAYNVNNDEIAVYIRRFLVVTAGAAYYFWNWTTVRDNPNIVLIPGEYTFATYTVPDTTNLRWLFQLE